jgi:hypothetical protein
MFIGFLESVNNIIINETLGKHDASKIPPGTLHSLPLHDSLTARKNSCGLVSFPVLP